MRIQGRLFQILVIVMAGALLLPVSISQSSEHSSAGLAFREMASEASALSKAEFDLRTSIRLTHLLYSAVLDRYMAEGLTKYRPDFLLNERYLRTFLYEWGLLLETGTVKSTREIWTSLSRRSSYLGAHFQVWKRILPNIFEFKEAEGINIGNRREGFLASVLMSETTTDFNQRSCLIVDFVSRDLMTEDADQELGLKILESFSVHGDTEVRKEAISLIQHFSLLSKIVSGLRWSRDIALSFAAGSNALPATTGKIISLGSGISLRLARAVRLPELTHAWRASSIFRASAVSVGAHATGLAVIAKRAADQKKLDEVNQSSETSLQEFRSAFQGAEANIQFLMALSVNTASERSPRLLQQADFPLPSNKITSLARGDWVRQMESVLRDWNATNRLPQGFNLWNLMLEGERWMGYWPRDQKLALATMASRYIMIKQRLKELKISDIEEFRHEIISNELGDYRGERRTVTSVLLDWGGNCVAQTLMLVSLLTEFPELVPQGAKLGVFLSPTHMEAVLFGKSRVSFLISGKTVFQQNQTILEPQALLAMLLLTLDPKIPIEPYRYFLNGLLQIPDSVKQAAVISNFESTHGDSGITPGAQAFLGEGERSSDPVSVPDHAKVTYQKMEFQDVFSEGDFERLFKAHSQSDSSEIAFKIHRVKVGKNLAEICYVPDGQQTNSCEFSIRTRQFSHNYLSYGPPSARHPRVIVRINDTELEVSDDGGSQTKMLEKLPPEMWLSQISRWILDGIVREMKIDSMSNAISQRAQQMTLLPEDLNALKAHTRLRGNNFVANSMNWFIAVLPKPTSFQKLTDYENLPELVNSATQFLESPQGPSQSSASSGFLQRSESLQKLKDWLQFDAILFQKVQSDPVVFVRAFAKLAPEVQVALATWGRYNSSGIYKRRIEPLRDYLDQLSPKQVSIARDLIEGEKKSSRPKTDQIKTAECHSPEGCAAFILIGAKKGEGGTTLPNEDKKKLKQKMPEANGGVLKLKASDVALLSLFSSGGLQLWNPDVEQSVRSNAVTWFSCLQPWYMSGGAIYWPGLNPKFANASYVKRATQVVSEVRKMTDEAMSNPKRKE